MPNLSVEDHEGKLVVGRAVGALGMRRVDLVIVTLHDAGPRAEVRGLGHRLPRTVSVPLATASGLVARGVPLRVRREVSAC